MNKKDGKTNRFEFTSNIEDEKDDFMNPLEDTQITDDFENHKEEVTTETPQKSNIVKPRRTFHFSFELRVTLLVIGILLLFAYSCFIIVKSLSANVVHDVPYKDKSSIDYNICYTSDDLNQSNCINSLSEYSSHNINNIHVTYQYDAKFSKNVQSQLSYYVVILNRIYDSEEKHKLLYEKENLVLNKTSVDIENRYISFDADLVIDFQKYNDEVSTYIQKYSENAVGQLEAILYIDDENQTRAVSKITIPLGMESFSVSVHDLDESSQTLSVIAESWSNHNTLNVVVGSILILLSLLLLFRLTRLVLVANSKKSIYDTTLMKILNEYDRFIVIARDGYASNEVKPIIKVESFHELLDAREILQKPIIFSRINNIKSEFIVEDEEHLYKYVLKEADLVQNKEDSFK